MKLFTVATHNYGYYTALIKSAKRNNFTLINIGKNLKWKGTLWKFKLMLKQIDKLDDNEIISFCDGFDVIIVNDSENLIKNFKLLNCDILFGNENSCNNPFINFLSYYSFKYQYLLHNKQKPNTGVYIGYAGKIKKFLKICLKEDNDTNDDQDIGYKIYYYQKKHRLKLKISNEYIYTIPFPYGIIDIFNYNVVKNITCDLNKVFFIHGNGDRNMDVYCNKLGLPNKIYNYGSNHKHLLHYSKKLINNNYNNLLIVLLIILFLINKN